jgi:hypothetical protein
MKTNRFTLIQVIFIVSLVMLFLWGCTGQDQEKNSSPARYNPVVENDNFAILGQPVLLTFILS